MENSSLNKIRKLKEFQSERKYSLPHYKGHYFHDTAVTMCRWRVVVLTVFFQVFKITVKEISDIKDQNRFKSS